MNSDLIEQFSILLAYYKRESDKGRTIAYSKVLASLNKLNKKIESTQDVKGLTGVGPKIIEKINEYLRTGKIQAVETAKKELENISEKDSVLQELQKIHAVGPKKAEEFYEKGIRSIEELRKRPGLLTDAQKIGLKYYEEFTKRIPRSTVTVIYAVIIYLLNEKYGEENYKLTVAGSYRRGLPTSGDIDCLITSNIFALRDVVELLREKNIITDILGMKNEKFLGVVSCSNESTTKFFEQHYRLDIEFVKEDEYGAAMLYFTGSKEFNKMMRSDAKKKGMLLNEHGLYYVKSGKKVAKNPTEEEIFALLKMEYVVPDRR